MRNAEPYLVDDGDVRSLHFEPSQVQSRVRLSDPDHLVLAYTRAMMGFLLLVPRPARIAMIGLGGGALPRACRRHLPDADFTAVELDRAVIALRDALLVPPDGPGFRVLHADGADYVRAPGPPLDVLLVDGFDRGGQPPALCDEAFYAACAARLAEGGVLVVNLNADATGNGLYVRRVVDAFAGNVAVVTTADGQNKIVFAMKAPGAVFPPPLDVLLARAEGLPTYLGLDELARNIDATRRVGQKQTGRRSNASP